MARISEVDENLVGKVCVCSLGRVGVVAGREVITFPNGDTSDCWTGMGFDGKGLWATGARGTEVVILAEDLAGYAARVKSRPSNVLYGTIAAPLPAKA
jgi:hypothetical protein